MKNTQARKQITAARTALVLDQPFFGSLALRLKLQEDPGCGTAWVDGVTLGYDPAFTEDLTRRELIALVAHEVMHCALGHPWRRSGREKDRWNVACDRVINPTLREAGFKLPEGALMELEPSHLGKSAEWVYDRLPRPQERQSPPPPTKQQDGGQGTGPGTADDNSEAPAQTPTEGQGRQATTPNALGEVRDAPKGSDEPSADEADWGRAVQQAATVTRRQGKLPGALDRLVKDQAESRVCWRSVLRRFVQQTARSDYSWQRPNPRYLPGGLYLPGLKSDEMPPLLVAIDTSGSIDPVSLEQFAAEVRAVVDEMKPEKLHVLYCDSKIQGHEIFEPGDPVEMKPKGGGGTDFRPVFKKLEEEWDDELPACVLYLTDLMGPFPDTAPDVPVLWLNTGLLRHEVPFGELVPMR